MTTPPTAPASHPLERKIRRAIFWSSSSLALLILAVWFTSPHYYLYIPLSEKRTVGIARGCVHSHSPTSARLSGGVSIEFHPEPILSSLEARIRKRLNLPWWEWTPRHTTSPIGSATRVPLWIPTLFLISIAVISRYPELRTARRSRAGHCIHCNYNLNATPAQLPCPECGTPRPSPPPLDPSIP